MAPSLDPRAAIEAGQMHYRERKYKSALEQFTRALKACPCTRGIKRERCSCKNYEDVMARSGSIFEEAMYKCSCSVGETFNKCSRPLHIQALDYRAATFEAMKELERARRDAEWMLELAPQLPDGYLRLGKVARLQKKAEHAWRIYCSGLEACRDNNAANPVKITQLFAAWKSLQLRFGRKDPLLLPREIFYLIFSRLDFSSLVRCLRVSRSWRRALTARGHERLWRTLLFSNSFAPRNAPSTPALQKLLSYSGHDVRDITIQDASRFRLSPAKFSALLRGGNGLRRLEIHEVSEVLVPPQGVEACKQLEHLCLSILPHVWSYFDPPHWLMQNSASTLRHLDVRFTVPHNQQNVRFPVMPRLKHLRVENQSRGGGSIGWIDLHVLSSQSPALEQLSLRKVDVHVDIVGRHSSLAWNNLRCFVMLECPLGRDTSLASISHLLALHQGRKLQHIELQMHQPQDALGDPLGGARHFSLLAMQKPSSFWGSYVEPGAPLEAWTGNRYENLQTLRVRNLTFHAKDSRSAFEAGARSGTLDSIDLCFPSTDMSVGSASIEYLKDHDWLRGAPSIMSLGIFEWRFPEYPRDDQEMPLPGFVASFPNLRTLEIGSSLYEEREFCTVIGAILKKGTGLKTIYQKNVTGTVMDQLVDFANKFGVELVWGERPRQWPVLLEKE